LRNGDALLYALGFLATSLYWPGVAGAATTPRWGAMLLIVPLLIRDVKASPAHWWGVAFLVLALVSVAWTPDPLNAGNQMFMLLLWLALFCLGSQSDDLRPFYIGCIAGLAISSMIALWQFMGWHPVRERYVGALPSGLFINGNYLAEAAGLAMVAAVSERMWWALPVLAPSLLLPQARGALVAVAAALAAYFWCRSRTISVVLLTVIAVAGGWVLIHPDPAWAERLDIWRSTVAGLTFWGHGLGSFWALYPALDLRVAPGALPDHAHNEFLQTAFELGVPGLVLALAFCVTLAGPIDTSRLVLIALAVESCFAFPLRLPATVAIGLLAAGHAVRDRYVLRDLVVRWRMALRARLGLPDLRGLDVVFSRRRTRVSFRAPFPGRGNNSNVA